MLLQVKFILYKCFEFPSEQELLHKEQNKPDNTDNTHTQGAHLGNYSKFLPVRLLNNHHHTIAFPTKTLETHPFGHLMSWGLHYKSFFGSIYKSFAG